MPKLESATPKPAGGRLRTLLGAAALLAITVLAGCATGGPMKLTHDADRQLACVAVQWTPREQIVNYCGRDNVYGLPNQACLVDGYRIVSPKPRDWNDETAMISLGHELYHALGARH